MKMNRRETLVYLELKPHFWEPDERRAATKGPSQVGPSSPAAKTLCPTRRQAKVEGQHLVFLAAAEGR